MQRTGHLAGSLENPENATELNRLNRLNRLNSLNSLNGHKKSTRRPPSRRPSP